MSDTSTETVTQDEPDPLLAPDGVERDGPFDDSSEGANAGDRLEAIFDAAEAAHAADLSGAPLEGLAAELTHLNRMHEEATHAERRQEVDDVEGVFDGPFDLAKAWAAVVTVNTEYQAAIREHARKHEDASAAKRVRDALGERLSTLIEDYTGRERDGQQPKLKTVDEAPDAMPGRDALLQTLSFALLGKQCFIDVADLARLHESDRGALHDWATSKKKGPIMPLVLATAHVAGESGADGQHCTKCGMRLERQHDLDEAMPYVAKSLIGLGCDGDQPEEARPVKRRGSKKTKQVDPEAERVEQAKAGKAKKGKGRA